MKKCFLVFIIFNATVPPMYAMRVPLQKFNNSLIRLKKELNKSQETSLNVKNFENLLKNNADEFKKKFPNVTEDKLQKTTQGLFEDFADLDKKFADEIKLFLTQFDKLIDFVQKNGKKPLLLKKLPQGFESLIKTSESIKELNNKILSVMEEIKGNYNFQSFSEDELEAMSEAIEKNYSDIENFLVEVYKKTKELVIGWLNNNELLLNL